MQTHQYVMCPTISSSAECHAWHTLLLISSPLLTSACRPWTGCHVSTMLCTSEHYRFRPSRAARITQERPPKLSVHSLVTLAP